MQVGLLAPQGWKHEYDGWQPADAWARTLDLARNAETLGFESLWVFDHFHTTPEPTDEITFESFSVLAALTMATERLRLGHMVVCSGFRNPALTAKLRPRSTSSVAVDSNSASAPAGRRKNGGPTATAFPLFLSAWPPLAITWK